MRKGVPLVADTVKANSDRGLAAISLTAYNSELQALVDKNGLKHSIGMMSIDTKDSPYVHSGKNGLTYIFVIGRDGRIAWRGNHAVKDKDFLKAVGKALAAKPVPALERTLAPALDEAAAEYYGSAFMDSRAAAKKIAAKHERKSGEDSVRIVEDAAFLVARIDALSEELLDRMKTALESRDSIAFVEASGSIAAGFAGSEANGQAKELEREALGDEEFAVRIKTARSWLALLEKRPVLFPASPDRASKAFAKKLEKFRKSHEGSAPAQEAARLLERFSGS